MVRSPAPPAVPWRTVMRERHVGVPRDVVWPVLLDVLTSDPGDLSVEPPWRHVRRVTVPGVDRCETTVTVRDDGDECHLAWYAGLTAEPEDDQASHALGQLAADGERLLERIAEGARHE